MVIIFQSILPSMNQRLIVTGGGAAGFFCAINAAAFNPQLEVIIIEKTGKILSKVKVSGGGRCNVTHACDSISEMIKCYPRGSHFLKKAFHQFFTIDTINWFLQRGVSLKTEPDGRMFPVTNSSETIIDCLVQEAHKNKVGVFLNRDLKRIEPISSAKNQESNEQEDTFNLVFANGEELNANYICIATGGYPKAIQFDWIRRLGHSIEAPVPSLFSFNLSGTHITELMGVSVEKVTVKIAGTKFSQEGPILITHWGFSGPAVLKLSSFAAVELAALNYNYRIVVNWLPSFNENTLLKEMGDFRIKLASQKINNRNPFYLPQRLWTWFLSQSGINENCRWSELPSKQQNILVKHLCTSDFEVKGKTTFKEEFVTSGGISLAEINPDSMESKLVPNVYFAGEVMNVDGITGGYNFQHAWTSGWIAAKAIAKKSILEAHHGTSGSQ